MGAGITVEIKDHATPQLQRIGEKLGPEAVAKVIGEDLVIAVQDHFRELDSSRANKLGGKRTHFFADAAAWTTWAFLGGDRMVLSVAGPAGIAQRFFGGTITPKNKDWLTIPARTEAYGKTAREFDNLRFILFRSGSAALVKSSGYDHDDSVDDAGNVSVTPRKKRALRDEGIVMFWLKKSVTQPADPSVLPTADRLAEVALSSLLDYAETVEGVVL